MSISDTLMLSTALNVRLGLTLPGWAANLGGVGSPDSIARVRKGSHGVEGWMVVSWVGMSGTCRLVGFAEWVHPHFPVRGKKLA